MSSPANQNNQTFDPNGVNDTPIPDFLSDPNYSGQQYDPNTPVQSIPATPTTDDTQVVSPGSPESPATLQPENQPQSLESGEVQPSFEVGAIENVEKKESPQDDTSPDISSKPKVEAEVEEVESGQSKGPKLYGYKISPSIKQELSQTQSIKNAGSTSSAKTWLYVLVDRLLKKHASSVV